MDKTTKFILGLIAVSLIGINIQMWNGKLINVAKAEVNAGDMIRVQITNWRQMPYR